MGTTHFSGPVFAEGGLVGAAGMGGPAGRVFYVNANTSSAARNADRPWYQVDGVTVFSTLQAAIDACVDDRGDVIYVARAYMAISTPVLFNKAGIAVIAQGYGMAPREQGEYFTLHNTTGGAPAATVSRSCRIQGLGFATANTGAKSCAMLLENDSSYPGWVHLNYCRFVNWGVATQYGINAEAGANNQIEHCVFEGTAAVPFTGGIAFGGSPTQNPIQNEVYDCRFRDCTYGIDHVDGTPQNFVYKENVFVDAKGVNTRNAAADGLICGNWYETATDTGTYDVAVATCQGNGIQFSGNNYSE
jgi:hypothetical protein